MATKEQLAVPASMAEQLDPSNDLGRSEIADGEIVSDPETRGLTTGKELKARLAKAAAAEDKAAVQSQKQAEKNIGDDEDTSKTTTGETIPTEVQKKNEEADKLEESRKEDLTLATDKDGSKEKADLREEFEKNKEPLP